jgi:hypothetical protein
MKKIYVTIGNPILSIPLQNLVAVRCEETEYRKIAKQFRKEIADEEKISPANLYWAIFDKLDAEKPILASDNFYSKETVQKELEKLTEEYNKKCLEAFNETLDAYIQKEKSANSDDEEWEIRAKMFVNSNEYEESKHN